MDLAHANEVLPQRTLHGLGQHRTPVALLGLRAVLAGVEGIAKTVEQFRLAAERRRGGDDGVEAVPRGPVGARADAPSWWSESGPESDR